MVGGFGNLSIQNRLWKALQVKTFGYLENHQKPLSDPPYESIQQSVGEFLNLCDPKVAISKKTRRLKSSPRVALEKNIFGSLSCWVSQVPTPRMVIQNKLRSHFLHLLKWFKPWKAFGMVILSCQMLQEIAWQYDLICFLWRVLNMFGHSNFTWLLLVLLLLLL